MKNSGIISLLACIAVYTTDARKPFGTPTPSSKVHLANKKTDDFNEAEERIFSAVEDAEKIFLNKVEGIVHNEVNKLHDKEKKTAFTRGRMVENVNAYKEDLKECLEDMYCGDIE